MAAASSRPPSVDAGQIAQALLWLRPQLSGSETPFPVSRSRSRQIHSPFRTEAEEILRRRKRQIRHRGPDAADHLPVDRTPFAAEIVERCAPFGFAQLLEPAARRVVVVRAGKRHRISAIVVRQEARALRVRAESEL